MNLTELENLLGKDRIKQDPEITKQFCDDWTGRFMGHTKAVISPRSTSEVSKTLNWCSKNHVNVVSQGGNTGMVGGSVPMNGELIISMKRMNQVSFSEANHSHIRAEAGATLSEIQALAASKSLIYGIDFGARDSATIGGTVATNAGGHNVVKYGSTRNQLVSVEAVTGTGTVIGNLNGLQKDNTGYHLPSLLCGSEGTLAIITQVELKLWPRPEESIVLLLGFHSIEDALETATACTSLGSDLSACELFFSKGLDLVIKYFNLPSLWNGEYSTYLLCEFTGRIGVTDRLNIGSMGEVLRSRNDVLIANTLNDQRKLWQYRELHTAAMNSKGTPLKLDVTLPLGQLKTFLDEIENICLNVNAHSSPYIFGHAADGNMHVNVLNSAPKENEMEKEVLMFVASLGGSISAEHGIGRAKSQYLHLQRSSDEIALFKKIKEAFDPTGILNPNAIFPTRKK